MPIPVECPDCRAELNIPDTLAGKLVKCPHCAGPVRVPSDETEEEEERPRERRPRPAPRREAPKRRAKAKNNSGVLIGASVGMLVIIGAAVGVTLLVRSGKKDTPTNAVAKNAEGKGGATEVVQGGGGPGPAVNPIVPVPVGPIRPPLPDGWIDFRHPQGEYSVHVPRKPIRLPPKRDNIPGWSETGYYTATTTIERPELICIMVCGTYPPQMMDAYRTGNMDLNIVERMFPGMRMTTNRITWHGRVAIEASFETDLSGMMAGLPGGGAFAQEMQKKGGLALPNGLPLKNTMYMRFVVVNDRVYSFAIQNIYGPPTEAEQRAFFDSVVFGR